MATPSRPSSWKRLMALVLVAFAVVAVFVTVWFPVRERISALAALQRKATNQAELVAYTIAPAVEFGDTHLVEEVFRGAARDADFVGIEARDSDGRRVGAYGDLSRSSAHSFVLANARIDMQTAGAGQVHLVMSTRRIDETSREQTLISITIGLTILALGFAISVRIGRSTREITALMEENARQRSAAERANEVKTRFLANMSHEMRTPLNGVLGLADVLSRYPLDERARGLVRVISRSGRTLLMLVNDILDLSRVEADRLELESAPFDPESIVMSVCEMFVPACREKGLELIARVDAEVPREFEGDRLRVEQVLTNLVGNAVKFTASGRVVVQLAWEEGAEVGALRLSVRDTGIGVAAAKLDVIFDAFSQADTSTTRRFGGSGLGLAISRSLVRRMDGDLTVQSVEGAGSTFTFNVPGRASAPAPPVVASDFPPLVAIASADPEVRSALREQAKRCSVECRDIEASSADIDGLPAGTALIWDAALPTGEPAVRRALERASSERDIRLVAHAAMIDEPPFGALMPQVLSKPCSRDAFERAVGSRGGTPTRIDAASDDVRGEGAASLRVLIAEDDETNRLVIASFLEEIGVSADIVVNGLHALNRVRESPPYDVILMDCQMPELDGYEATKQIRLWESEERRAPVPIVAVTAHALAEERARAVACGMNGHVTKPLTLESFRAAFAAHVRHDALTTQRAARAPVVGEREIVVTGRFVGSPELLRRVSASFAQACDDAIVNIAEDVAKGAWEAARQHAHTIKGSCMAVGADRAADLCAELEVAVRAENSEQALALLVHLEIALLDVQGRLRELSIVGASAPP